MTSAAEIAAFRDARERVLATIANACARSGRSADDVRLVAISKTVPSERVAAAVAAGLTLLGENRVQEGEAKAAAVRGGTWHLVGPLQSNKAKRAIRTFAMIQTVDSVDLAERLDRLVAEVGMADPYPVLVQVNVDRDVAKSGFPPDELEAAAERLDGLSHLDIRGLMTVGRLVARAEDARPTFAALRARGERLRGSWPRLGPELSMGMTDDYPVAVEEGATIVRVGRAIFGDRPHHDGPDHGNHDDGPGGPDRHRHDG